MALTGKIRAGEYCVCGSEQWLSLAVCRWASSGWNSTSNVDSTARLACIRILQGAQTWPRQRNPMIVVAKAVVGWASTWGLWCGVPDGVDEKGFRGLVVNPPPKEGLQGTTSLCICANSATGARKSPGCTAVRATQGWLAGYGEIWRRCEDAQCTFG